MKCSWILAGVILAAGGLWCFRESAQLTCERENLRRLEEQAHELGLDPMGESPREEQAHSNGRARVNEADRVAEVKASAVKLIAFAKDLEASEKASSRNDPEVEAAMQKRMLEVVDTMLKLDASGLKRLLSELRADSQLGENMKRAVINFTVAVLTDEHPAAALAVIAESKEFFGDGNRVSSALSKWAESDPVAALAWVRANAVAHPEWMTEDTKRGLVSGAGRRNPRLAIQWVGELGVREIGAAGSELARSVSPEDRLELVTSLRDQTPGVGDAGSRAQLRSSVLWGLGEQVSGEGFERTRGWLDKAALTESEAGQFYAGVSEAKTKEETGKWIEWAAGKLPANELAAKTEQLVGQWTREDYHAAGEWLNATPDGPAKQVAVRSYAQTVAPYDPETAAQWAVTLPAGKERELVMKRVRDEWEKKDEAAAAEFARKNGIEE